MQNQKSEYNWNTLNSNHKEIIKATVIEAIKDAPEIYTFDSDKPEGMIKEIEFESTAFFTPFEYNRGGVEIKAYTILYELWKGGVVVGHKKAQETIEKYIDYNFKLHREATFNKFKDVLTKHGLTEEQIDYGTLEELSEKHKELKEAFRYFEDTEYDFIQSNDDTVMFNTRFIYGGFERGKHFGWLSCAINTEAPYHRSSISWLPNAFCEGAKEVKVSWKTAKELKQALKKAKAKVVKEIF